MRPVPILAVVALSALAASPPKPVSHDPGRVTARRLNRYEYNHTVRDLLAIDFQPAAEFPADDFGYGFDNIGDVLSLSPVLMEKYLAAAERIAKIAILPTPLPKPTTRRYGGADNIPAPRRGILTVRRRFPVEGDYDFVVGLYGRPDPAHLRLTLDRQPLAEATIESAVEDQRTTVLHAHVTMGEHVLRAEPIPDGPHAPDLEFETGKKPKPRSEPGVGFIEVRGPYHPEQPPPSEGYRRIFSCTKPAAQSLECARADLANLARRAYRRPVSRAEVDGLVRFVETARQQGDSFEQGMQTAVTAILVSPHFLFRLERDPHPEDPRGSHRLNDFELATRLSYFLWSSMPDDELFRLAAARRTSQLR